LWRFAHRALLCFIPFTATLGLSHASQYHYTNQSGCEDIAGVDDAAEFDATMEAMTKLNFSQQEKTSVLSVIAAILHLGNVGFQKLGGDDAKSEVNPATKQGSLDSLSQRFSDDLLLMT
jgi:myosin heavy subunit